MLKWPLRIGMLLLTIIIFSSCTNSNNQIYEVEEISGIVYRTIEDRDLVLNITRPVNLKGTLPVLVFAPGSFNNKVNFLHFKKEQFRQSSRGYITVCVEYRDDMFPPYGIFDMKTAIRWIRVNADEYSMNPEMIALIGSHEGINRAMVAVLSDSDYDGDAEFPKVSNRVKAIVNVAGEMTYDKYESLFYRMGGTPEEYPERYDMLNVLKLINKSNPPIMTVSRSDNDNIDRYLLESLWLDKTIRFFGNESIWIARGEVYTPAELITFDGKYNPIDNFLDFYLQ